MNNILKSHVYLRTILLEDAQPLMELNNDPQVSSFVVGNPQIVTLEQQINWIKNLHNETNTRRWAICYDDLVCGMLILTSIDNNNKTANANIKLLPRYQGQGIAKKALGLAIDIAFGEMGMECLTAHILPYNDSSLTLFERSGFSVEGTLKSRVIKNGERYDLISLSLKKEDWVNRYGS